MKEMWIARDKNGELIMYEKKNHSKINLQSNGGHRADGSDFYLKKVSRSKMV